MLRNLTNRSTRWAFAVALTIGSAFTLAQAVQSPQANRPTGVGVQSAGAGESLDGTWELVSVIDDGKVIPLDLVKQTMIKDLRVVVKGPIAAIIRPDDKVQTLAFVTDPKASPKTLDVAGPLRIGGKGIYMRDGNTLMICTREAGGEARPTVMASLPNSDTFLMTFRRVDVPPSGVNPIPLPPAIKLADDNTIGRIMIGTWGHQTGEQVVKLTLNADGTFSRSTTFKKGFKNIFDAEERMSGKWQLKDGNVTLTASASTEREQRGQVYSFRIITISEAEVRYVDNQTGQQRIEWKLR